jgi:hypothetical protein
MPLRPLAGKLRLILNSAAPEYKPDSLGTGIRLDLSVSM